MLLADKPELPPHKCIVCDAPSGQMVDLDRNFFIGGLGNASRLYLCVGCVIEAGNLVGCASPEQLQELKRSASELNDQNIALDKALAEERDKKVVSLDDLRHVVTGASTLAKATTKPAA